MPRSDEARIGDIVEAGQRIKKHIGDLNLEDFRNNDTSMRAVLFDLTVIGEAAKGISAVGRSKYPNLPWMEMAGMRDVVVHQYFGIEVKTVWNAATVSVPNVLKVLMSGSP